MKHSRSILWKMLATSSLLVGFLIMIGSAGIYALAMVSQKYEHVATVNLPNSQILNSMQNEALEISRSYLRMALPGTSKEELKKRKDIIKESVETYQKYDTAYQAIPFVAGEQELYDELNKNWIEFIKSVHELIPLLDQPNGREKFQKHVQTTLSDKRAKHGQAMKRVIDFQAQESKIWVTAAHETADIFNRLMFGFVLIGAIIAMLLSFASARSLSRTLRTISKDIDESGSQVRSASEQLSTASQQLSSGATQAASALEETVASVEELTSMVKLNADNAREASALSETSRKSAEEGELEITKLNTAIHEIAQSSKKIEEIINVIDDIAFQTNLLALNAAVEAARAGEQGKGFAVVAEAVRTLAQRSAAAAKDITTLIKESVIKIERGEKMADESGSVLKNIVVSVTKVANLNNEIATASQEQAHGLSQISKAMNELDQATQRNASSAEETAASSEEMSSQAGSLEVLVGHLNAVIEGRTENQNQETSSQESAAPRTISHGHGGPRKTMAKVTPFKRHQPTEARNVLPLNADEMRNRKVGNIDGF
ncbi:MAG TPA: methyl-accepting chemotaxis protein [Oligoflexus sp.]|uniref:methyl-accepting chemotaxis protein n=1 Tax=Oligoflexus sp. TaxID=1971216 RepID=UPI002D3C6E57|nr:methyl-accepting chemotaxis protein [Oligoflexus sp.]HYX38843.1 methyl-accepting chemotaxis protein [Oligoflexus sp.]